MSTPKPPSSTEVSASDEPTPPPPIQPPPIQHPAPIFRLDLRGSSGSHLGHYDLGDGFGDVYEFMSHLRIRNDVSGYIAPAITPTDDEYTGYVPPAFEEDGLAVYVDIRAAYKFYTTPVGLFQRRLDARDLAEIHAAVESIDWPGLPTPVGGQITATHLQFDYVREGLTISRAFNAESTNFMAKIAPLMTLLGQIEDRLAEHPAAAVGVAVEVEQDPRDPKHVTLRWVLTNLGSQSVAITDPRVPRPEPARPPRPWNRSPEVMPRASWEVIDSSEMQWGELIHAPALPNGAPSTLILRPKQRFEITRDWQVPGPGRYTVKGTWMDYEGPLEPAPDQQAFMPLPRSGPASLGRGPYPVRGAAFAQDVQFVVE